VLAVLLLTLSSATNAAVGVTFTVNSTGDLADANAPSGPWDGVCATATGSCTLRAAIQESNQSVGFQDTIAFATPAAPIRPTTELPLITDSVVIDGTTHPDFVDEPLVELSGDLLPTSLGSRGLRIRAGETEVRGLVINHFQSQIAIGEPQAGDGVRIVGNYLGTDGTGTTGLGGIGSGIHVRGGKDHVIGGAGAADRNVISGNGFAGITIEFGAGKVTILGNYIGTNADGDAPVTASTFRTGHGIYSASASPTVIVGGAGAGEGNLISGNGANGIFLQTGTGHQIIRNRIGTDSGGQVAVPNLGSGVATVGLRSTVIRGNLVSGNGSQGLVLAGDVGTVVEGNKIGVDDDGVDPIPNLHGIELAGTMGVQIGGTTDIARNIISGNRFDGIVFTNVDASRNRIEGNLIGVGARGAQVGNGQDGIACCGTSNSFGNVIGGALPGSGNVIAYNKQMGVRVTGNNLTLIGPRASILGNSIHSNGLLGIDLPFPTASPTTNDTKDPDIGPNDLQNFPIITGISSGGGQTIVGYSINSTPDTALRLEFFRNSACDSFGYGEGQTMVGVEQVHTNVDGDWSGSITVTGETAAPEAITATATRFSEPSPSLAGATSEFSRCLVAPPPLGATVTYEKATVPASDPQDFAFVASGGGLANGTLDTDPDSTTPSSHTDTLTASQLAGTKSIAEAVPAGWTLSGIICTGTTATRSGDSVNFTVSAGSQIVCTFTNTKNGSVTLKKTTNGVVDPNKAITFVLTGPGLPAAGIVRTTLSDQDGVLVFGTGILIAGRTYRICETPVPAGFTSFWKLDGTIVTPFNPDASRAPPEDLGTRCYDFSVIAEQTRAFEVDNSRPGGDPRTIGYWKNWNRCTGGNQSATAQKNGGAAAGFFLVEDLLPQTIGDFTVTSCQQAVKLLSKQDQDARSKSSDAAYELSAQLLAARFNLAAGAETCLAVQQAVLDGQTLLDQISFTGSGDYLGSKSKDPRRSQALSIAATLDRYNNGNIC
jgi:CSLREA domain-containing protein